MFRCTCWVVVVLSCAAGRATADVQIVDLSGPPHYRFAPRTSTLNESGGIAGIDKNYTIRGTFDFDVRPGPTDVWPPRYEAKFLSVEAWASHPHQDYTLDLDDVLNLSGLTGHQLPVEAPFDLFVFDGKTLDDSRVTLFASLVGPWLYLRGGTEAPPGSADFFEYRIKALARLRPSADVDLNGVVDGADLAAMMRRFGLNSAAGTSSTLGDADGDLDVDGGDFLSWQRQLGEVPPLFESLDAMVNAALASSATKAVAAAGVPEPASAVLAVAAGLGVLWARRRR